MLAPAGIDLPEEGNALAGGATLADATDATTSAAMAWLHGQRQKSVDMGLLDPQTGMPTPAGWKAAGMAVAQGMGTNNVGATKAFHTAYEPFSSYDWSKLGATTRPNVSGSSVENWAMNLAKIGPWAHERPLVSELGGGVALPVQLTGKPKPFQSLDDLESAVRKAGGAEKFRKSMTDSGFGHIVVPDEEFGGKSYIGLTPANFSITPQGSLP